MTPAGAILAEEIRRTGPIDFRRFMETALYDPQHGYYRRHRDPFGQGGDFFTAEQVQPVFGILMAARVRALYQAMGSPENFAVVELGAGRSEMAEAFREWHYIPVEIGAEPPERFCGVVFSNEFFDALPVEAAIYINGGFRRQLVGLEGDRFVWQTGAAVRREVEEYLRRFFPPPEEGRWYEANLEALAWMRRICETLTEGYVLTIDYGYTRAESIRFPAGTLMGYRSHTARDNVLEDPGERDITAHVNFTALEESGAEYGLVRQSFGTLVHTLLEAGEVDQFAAALGGENDMGRRLQLKTLLFGMGETFRVLVQGRE